MCVCISTQLWFRTGIRQQNPEGTSWEPIQVPREVMQVSAGPKDLLWVVLWDGQLLARTGISKDCPKGLTRTDIFLSFEFTHTVCTTYSTCLKWLTHRCYLWSNCNHVSVMLLALQRYEHTEVLKNMWSLAPQLNISECHCFKLQEVNTNAAGGCCCHFCSTSLSQFSSNVLTGQFQYKFQ